MLITKRKKHPYYGKYKCKANLIYNRFRSSEKWRLELINFLEKNFKEDEYNLSGIYAIYFKEESHLNKFRQAYENEIYEICVPAVGYEHLTGRGEAKENVLWYDRFPYKLVVEASDTENVYDILDWCDANLQGDYRKSGYIKKISFFFINYCDAIAFKLAYGDIIIESYLPDIKKAEKALRNRVKQAQQDLKQFIENAKEYKKYETNRRQ